MIETKFNINTNEYLPLRDVVFNTLRDAILTGKLLPGERLMENQLADVIRGAAQTGTERIQIHLAPQNLGSLVIEMTKDANGALQVVLHTSNAKAAGVLNQHLDGLHNALQSYGQEEVRVEVQRGQESQEQHFKQADPDGRGQHQQRQQQERHEEDSVNGQEFLQKLRLGLFGTDEL